MLGVMGICASIPAMAQEVITVSDAEEFIKAIGSNRTIEMKPGVYNLSVVMNYMHELERMPYVRDYDMHDGSKEERVGLCGVFDGLELLVENVSNLTIKPSDPENTPCLQVEPRYAFVMRFRGGRNIHLDGLSMGHTFEGQCQGGVIGLDDVENFSITGCDLYGCGTEGICAENVTGLYVGGTTIRDCTYDIMTVKESQDVLFSNCLFLRNMEYSLVNISWSNVNFVACAFLENEGPLFDISDSEVSLNSYAISHDKSKLGNIEDVHLDFNGTIADPDEDGMAQKLEKRFDEGNLYPVDDPGLGLRHPCVGAIIAQLQAGLAYYGRIRVGNNGGSNIERYVNAFCSHYPGNVTTKSILPTKGVKVTLDAKAGYFHSDTDPTGKTKDGLEMCYWKMDGGRNIVAVRLNYTNDGVPNVLLIFYRYEPGMDILVPLELEGPDSWEMDDVFPACLYDRPTVELPRQGKDIKFTEEAGAPVRVAKWNNGHFE